MFFLFSFFLGVVCMNLWRGNQTSMMLMLQQFFSWDGEGLEVASGDLFVFLLKERGLLFLILAFFGSGRYGKLFHGLFVTYLGFGTGLIFASFLLVFGMMGAVLAICSVFPQIFFYLLLYFLLFKGSGVWRRQKGEYAGDFSGKEKGAILCFYAVLAFILVLGVLAEAYMNPVILEKIRGLILG